MMKFLNGQVYPKPVRKTLLVIGIVLTAISLPLLITAIAVMDGEDRISMLVFFAFCFTPGLVLLIIGISKIAANKKEFRKMQNVDYEAWKTARLNDPAHPLFRVNCNRCGGVIEYDFTGIDGKRAWFPNGYIVCPKCRAIMRHDAARATVRPETQSDAQI